MDVAKPEEDEGRITETIANLTLQGQSNRRPAQGLTVLLPLPSLPCPSLRSLLFGDSFIVGSGCPIISCGESILVLTD